MSKSHYLHYAVLVITLIALAFFYVNNPRWRISLSLVIGAVYFFSGVLLHLREKSLSLTVILEYFALTIFGITILIFISLRA
jgi:hypothetical protein